MKQSTICFLVFLFLLVSLSPASSRFLSASEVKEEENNGEVTLAYSLDQMETFDSLNKLMGLEECEEEDGECFKRRTLTEAHLDYIYTQNHNHP
ncbi:putative phytosulfokines 6 isoform X1 [Nicotiana tabacum]|uniref:Phytosulfokine n=1 Tax=Nicotiana tabacum TaxID=4097 RepID=A0A1S4CAQ9_TOBAC|nr:PREDICTED: putative phytosulfokines 6 [Nicotiana tabacum]